MCLILFGWQAHPEYQLIVAANRDEYYARPTAAAHWWDSDILLGGRDLESGGTWLGITPHGRFAALTNHRDFYHPVEGERSRGLLVTDALKSSDSSKHFIDDLITGELDTGSSDRRPVRYEPFNLLVGDGDTLFCYESKHQITKEISPGIYGLSNAFLDTDWPKVERGKTGLTSAIRENRVDSESLFSILTNRQMPPEDRLPDTGIGEEWERVLSPCFIEGEEYGTRSSSVLLVGYDGSVRFYERRYLHGKELFEDNGFTFNIPGA